MSDGLLRPRRARREGRGPREGGGEARHDGACRPGGLRCCARPCGTPGPAPRKRPPPSKTRGLLGGSALRWLAPGRAGGVPPQPRCARTIEVVQTFRRVAGGGLKTCGGISLSPPLGNCARPSTCKARATRVLVSASAEVPERPGLICITLAGGESWIPLKSQCRFQEHTPSSLLNLVPSRRTRDG